MREWGRNQVWPLTHDQIRLKDVDYTIDGIHLVCVCLQTAPQPFPELSLKKLRPKASSEKSIKRLNHNFPKNLAILGMDKKGLRCDSAVVFHYWRARSGLDGQNCQIGNGMSHRSKPQRDRTSPRKILPM